jgi:hypothetical protein
VDLSKIEAQNRAPVDPRLNMFAESIEHKDPPERTASCHDRRKPNARLHRGRFSAIGTDSLNRSGSRSHSLKNGYLFLRDRCHSFVKFYVISLATRCSSAFDRVLFLEILPSACSSRAARALVPSLSSLDFRSTVFTLENVLSSSNEYCAGPSSRTILIA